MSVATQNNDEAVTPESIRILLRNFADERDWNKYHTPRNLCMALVGECGELAEIFQWKSFEECENQLNQFTDKKKVHVGEEISDCMFYLLRLADKCAVDLPRSALAKRADSRSAP